MNREEVASLASSAGFGGNQRNTLAVKLERFAALVAAAERERCAKVCDERYLDYMEPEIREISAAIRALP